MAEPGRGAEPLWRTPPGRLAPPHIYRMAGALGAELRRLSGRFGPEAVAGLVPPVVRLLELLEALVAPAGAEGEASVPPAGRQNAEDPEQRLWEAERRERALHGRLACLEEQNRQLLGQLAESQSQEDSTVRKERELMLRLKEVVDKQRDELRAQAHEIVCKSRDTEAVSVWELTGVVCEGPGDLLSCHLAPGAVVTAAPGATASLHGHERGPASQGGRGAGSAQKRAGEKVGPGGHDAANPEGNEQEEQDLRDPAAKAQPGRSAVACGGAAAPGRGRGQEPCSLLLLQGRAAADPARAERAQDQPVLGAGGAGLLPAGAAERRESAQLLLGCDEVDYQKTEKKNQSQNAGNGGGVGEQR
ncbi:rab-interacting lysosomal protein isoform X3 [Calonectris borealis]|uniref:rab-interacting lysosomal protein isoform X3 n=1 Tax=Calonectris borealis TaxID=1323832 RepID=UPI003F4B8F29